MNLFNTGAYTLHSGKKTHFKIDCDALVHEDLIALAKVGAEVLPAFGEVIGVPRGGLKLAYYMGQHATEGPRLIVDDVLTTGASMEEYHQPGDIGLVLFARGPCPSWVRAIFTTDA